MGDVPRQGRTPSHDDENASLDGNLALALERGELPGLMVNAVRRGRWLEAQPLLTFARRPSQKLEVLLELLEAIETGVAQIPEARRARAERSDELRALRLEAAEAVRSRLRRMDVATGLSPEVRHGMSLAARTFARADDHLRAAEMFEQAEDFAAAAESWGALGELERMEDALARVEALRHAAVVPGRLWRDARERAAHGDRLGALELLARLPAEHPEAAEAQRLQHELAARLIRTGGLVLRASTGELLRVGNLPATLGRDPACQVTLRDPGISRQHARVSWSATERRFALEDLGSKAGTRIGPAHVDPHQRLLLGPSGASSPSDQSGGQGAFSLGTTCLLTYQVLDEQTLRLTVTSGFDRGLVTLLGPGPLAPSDAGLPGFAALAGVSLDFSRGHARWRSPGHLRTLLGDRAANPEIDLLRGDRIRLEGPGFPAGPTPLFWEIG